MDGTQPEFCQLTVQNGWVEIETEGIHQRKKLIGLCLKSKSLPSSNESLNYDHLGKDLTNKNDFLQIGCSLTSGVTENI
ncbi:hypothetical protein TNCV_2890301 [Trichonephila clavipes]|nr:hypothetical protein TNCV_2890301 [Trichonephila clavipes]